MELFKVMTIDEVKQVLGESFDYKLHEETVNIVEAVDRICYENINAGCNIPDFKRSTVDGYAVNARSVQGAGDSIPSMLDLKGEVLMGKIPERNSINAGECMYVPTGGMLPQGADCVVMVEYSEKLDDNTVLIYSPAAPGDNVIQAGEDISIGENVINEGEKIRPYEIGVLAGLGIDKIKVYKKLKVGVISTGDELVPCDVTPKLGQIRDINTYLLSSQLVQSGAEPISYGIISDDFDLLKETVAKAIVECDIVLISGGSSVGKKDQTLRVINSFNEGEILVHGVAIKPGKPTIIGKCEGKAVFGLPGHPLACSIVYKILVKYYINKLMKYNSKEYGLSAEFSINYHKAKGREEYLPVRIVEADNRIIAEPVFGKSGLITTFSRAYGYIRIDRNLEGLKEGQQVQVYSL